MTFTKRGRPTTLYNLLEPFSPLGHLQSIIVDLASNTRLKYATH
jgi:hypothetical protein